MCLPRKRAVSLRASVTSVTHILVNASQDESKLVTDRTERRVEKHSKPSQDILMTGNYALTSPTHLLLVTHACPLGDTTLWLS